MGGKLKGEKHVDDRGYARRVVIAASVIGLVGLIYIGLAIRQTEPDYYRPAHTALVAARQHLEASLGQETALLEQLQGSHKNLEAAIAALDEASIDPDVRNDVAALRARLRALEDVGRLQDTSPQQLRESYRAISHQLGALIEEIERRQD
ncbi:MAG: hypothetical protein H6953_04960 [Chromatiaceae bacterium]|nr:hypothetical protein [Chromatiaceae bacterium]MCP5314501.1 hypothetical protein [Chromatiaceae bacterium]